MATVSWLLLTNDVVSGEPFQATTALLLKLPPFTVSENPAAPAVALLGEIEVTDGVAGQPPQETTGSNKIANAPKSVDIFIAIGLHIRQISGRADSQGRDFERIISVAIQLVDRVDRIIKHSGCLPLTFGERPNDRGTAGTLPTTEVLLFRMPGAPFLAFFARNGSLSLPAEHVNLLGSCGSPQILVQGSQRQTAP